MPDHVVRQTGPGGNTGGSSGTPARNSIHDMASITAFGCYEVPVGAGLAEVGHRHDDEIRHQF